MKTITMRVAHRYLGFFLLGIMVIYALSGVILIYRDTDTFKQVTVHEVTVAPGLNAKELKAALDIRRLRDVVDDGKVIRYSGGQYDKATGATAYTTRRYPPVIKEMNELHTASTEDGAYWLNVFFGLSLLFFSVSSFWMFKPKSKLFTKGMMVTGVGILFAIAVLML